MAQYLTDTQRGIKDAIVVHIGADVRGPWGEWLNYCDGEPNDADSTRDLPNDRVICEVCRRKLLSEME